MFNICKSCANDRKKESKKPGTFQWFYDRCDWCKIAQMVTSAKNFGIKKYKRC